VPVASWTGLSGVSTPPVVPLQARIASIIPQDVKSDPFRLNLLYQEKISASGGRHRLYGMWRLMISETDSTPQPGQGEKGEQEVFLTQ
jgi:hypothetical protein